MYKDMHCIFKNYELINWIACSDVRLFLFRDDVVPESNDHMEHTLPIPGDPFTVLGSRSVFWRYCNTQSGREGV